MEENEKVIIGLNSSDEVSAKIASETSLQESEHHHHHHHRRHHSSHRKSNSKKKNKLSRFVSQNKNKFINISIALLLVIVLIIVGFFVDRSGYEKSSPETSKDAVKENTSISVKAPFFAEDIVIVGPAVTEFMESVQETSSPAAYSKYAVDNMVLESPVTISYEIQSVPDGYSIKSTTVYVDENSDFSNPMAYTPEKDKTEVEVYHLKTNTQYYYKISLKISNGTVTSVQGSFKTADTPRILSIAGVGNLRDIGGYKTIDGKTVKQGLLYRGCEIDGAVEARYAAPSSSINTMITVLGIRTDMDLRSSEDTQGIKDAFGAKLIIFITTL